LGDYKYLVTLRKIKNGEELLVDYNKDKDLEQPEEGWGKVDI
jgi:SET domain-containing protein